MSDPNKHYILDGSNIIPVTLETWREWFSKADRIIARTDVCGGLMVVSTVFLGLDHNCMGSGPPILFETMVFSARTGDFLDEQERYTTREEAEAGHKAMCEKVEQARCAPMGGDR